MSTVIDDETLVAYLDGELPLEQVNALEAGLTTDEQLRHRLQLLQSTWNLLGELPEATPNPDLARSTIEMVTVALERESDNWWSRLKRKRVLMLTVSMAAMLGVGAIAGSVLATRDKQKLLEELPAIALMPALENIHSREWLDVLSNMPDLLEAGYFLIENKGASGGRKLIGSELVPEDLNDREAWVESLKATDRAKLKESVDEFHLPNVNQEELRSIAAHILQDRSQSARLLNCIRAYHALLDDRDSLYITFLNLKPVEEREQTVRQLVAGVMCQKYAVTMSRADRIAIDAWVSNLQFQFQFDSIDPLAGFEDFGVRVFEELSSTDGSLSKIDDESLEMLYKKLTPQAVELLQNVEDEGDRRRYLGLWVLTVFERASAASTSASADQLQSEFESMKPEERRRLELMPERRARSELARRLGVETPLP